MKYFELTKEENKILKDYEAGKLVSVKALEKKIKLSSNHMLEIR